MVVARADDEDEDDVATTERERTARIAKGAYKIMQRHGFYPFQSYVFQLEKWSKVVPKLPGRNPKWFQRGLDVFGKMERDKHQDTFPKVLHSLQD